MRKFMIHFENLAVAVTSSDEDSAVSRALGFVEAVPVGHLVEVEPMEFMLEVLFTCDEITFLKWAGQVEEENIKMKWGSGEGIISAKFNDNDDARKFVEGVKEVLEVRDWFVA